MQLTEELFLKLIKYNKIQGHWIELMGCDCIVEKLSKNKGKVWLKNLDTLQIQEVNISAINTVGGMPLERWLNSINMNPDGTFTYLEINDETDFELDIKGKKTYTYHDIPLINDMTIIFMKDKNKSICGKCFKLKGINTETGIYLKNMKGRPRTAKKGE